LYFVRVSKDPQKKVVLDSLAVFDFGHFWKNKNVHFPKMALKILQKTCRKHNALNTDFLMQKVAA